MSELNKTNKDRNDVSWRVVAYGAVSVLWAISFAKMFFSMSNGWLLASAKLPPSYSQIAHFNFTNSVKLRATNISYYLTTP